jgi:hypothetical protein
MPIGPYGTSIRIFPTSTVGMRTGRQGARDRDSLWPRKAAIGIALASKGLGQARFTN